MIKFKCIRYKNFLSTGNVPNVIDLDKHTSTLITGKNGEGKSTVLCALTYALFNKPFRNINKPQLINSINQKNLLVEIDFEIAGKSYTVKRGMKPNVFQIICDGKLLNEEADTRDYQKILEQQILKLNFKTFTQVVILGSATFVPFMQLPAQKRREVIEDILDIKIFSVMNTILKEKMVLLKDSISKVENDITSHKIQIESQQKLIDVMKASKHSITEGIKQKIKENTDWINTSIEVISQYTKDNEKLLEAKKKYSNISSVIQQADGMRVKFQTILDSKMNDMKFFNNTAVCSQCKQDITEEHKNIVIDDIKKSISDHENKINELNAVYEKLTKQLEKLNEIESKIAVNNSIINNHNNTISVLNNTINQLNSELSVNTTDDSSISEEINKLNEYIEISGELVNKKSELLNNRHLYDVATGLLKDSGIKTAIIHEYLPAINKLINKYLNAMDFYAKFELDESFQEIIKSRNRDVFTYNSFSEGEKRRIDLSILFTWRQIAKMKNSVNTNIMILDEILDGSLDGGGIDYFLSIMNQFGENTNVFVISHRDVSEKFDHVIKVEKRNDFSIIS